MSQALTYGVDMVISSVLGSNVAATGHALVVLGYGFGVVRSTTISTRVSATGQSATFWQSNTAVPCRSVRGISHTLCAVVTQSAIVRQTRSLTRAVTYNIATAASSCAKSNFPSSGAFSVTVLSIFYGHSSTVRMRLSLTNMAANNWSSDSAIAGRTVASIPSRLGKSLSFFSLRLSQSSVLGLFSSDAPQPLRAVIVLLNLDPHVHFFVLLKKRRRR